MATATKPAKDGIVAVETSFWDAMLAKDGARTAQLLGTIGLVTGAQGILSVAKSKMQDGSGKMTQDGKSKPESYALDNIEVATPVSDMATLPILSNRRSRWTESLKTCVRQTAQPGVVVRTAGNAMRIARPS